MRDRLLLLVVIPALVGLSASRANAASWMVVTAQPWDPFSLGHEVIVADSSLRAERSPLRLDSIVVSGTTQVLGDRSTMARFEISVQNQALAIGTYEVRSAGNLLEPTMSYAVVQGCYLIGSFTIHELASSGTTIERLAVDFLGYCWEGGNWAYGAVRINSAVPYENATMSEEGGPDIVWRLVGHQYAPVGALWGTRLSGSDIVRGRRIQPDISDPAWRIVGTGDFNGDHHADLVFQHSDGRVAFWFLSRTTRVGTAAATPDKPLGVNDPDWRVVAVADFNADGKPDLVWHHATSGDIAVWLMNGTRLVDGQWVGRVPDVDWRIAAAGDLNRDGYADLVWRHEVSGWASTWIMRGTMPFSGFLLRGEPVEARWKLRGLTDADRDGWLDVIWESPTEQRASIWFMQGTFVRAWSMIEPPISSLTSIFYWGRWEIAAVR